MSAPVFVCEALVRLASAGSLLSVGRRLGMTRTGLLAFIVLAASCAAGPVRNEQIADAVKWGVAACERHFLEGVALGGALAASAEGRAYALDTRNVEYWHTDAAPFRLDGLSVYVGANDADEDERECRLIAVGAGAPALRDTIIEERVARTDRTWTDATRNARGLRAACTVDRVPGQRSMLTAEVQIWPRVDTASIPNDPLFEVVLEMQDSCDREPGYWM